MPGPGRCVIRRSKIGRRVALVTCAAAGLLTGCSGDDGSAPPASTTAVNAATSTASTAAPTTAPGTTAAPGTEGTAPPATATTTSAAPATTIAPGSIGDGRGATLGDPLVEIEDITSLAVRSGDDAFYIAGRDGTVWSWRRGSDPVAVLDLTDLTESGGEQGLLGLTFAPDGTKAYVDYTSAGDGATHVDELAVAPDGTIDPSSRRELLVVEQPYANHNGGQLAIGPDGLLYIGLGDGGSANDPERRALDLGELLGKILRIDPAGDPYTVPADNPFVGVDGARPEIWSSGLRNPWRFSFDAATGDLWIGDVGQGDWEEIDHAPATAGRDAGRGLNFGWSALEGTHPLNDDQSAEGATPPLYEYSHDDGCSVTGGEVYRGSAIPGLAGWYVFADYCQGTVWALQVVADDDGTLSAGERIDIGTSADVAAIEPGPDGELYVLSLSEGLVPIVPA
jgi:glucose/arabinose dehydrogenase